MYLFQYLPEFLLFWLVYGILFLGILGVAAISLLGPIVEKVIPYSKVIWVISIILIVVGIYLKGGLDVEMHWRKEVKELKNKIAIAEEQSEQKNKEVKEKIIYRTKVIKEKGDIIIQYVDKNAALEEFDKKCPIPKDIVTIHNKAASVEKGDK